MNKNKDKICSINEHQWNWFDNFHAKCIKCGRELISKDITKRGDKVPHWYLTAI